MAKVLAIIVSYFPDKNRLRQNIDAFIEGVDHLIIWENMPRSKVLDYRVYNMPKIEYHTADGNVGISKALNFGLLYAQSKGYDYLLTMDQDSVFENFDSFKQACIVKQEQEKCIIGPLVNRTIQIKPSFVPPEDTNIITSGMFVPVRLLTELGGYCDKLFVDGIDIELCLKAYESGINVYQYSGSNLNQRFGVNNVINIFGHKIVIKNYSPSRIEEIVSSNLMMVRKYKKAVYLRPILRYYFFLHPLVVLIAEDNKARKLKSIYSGFIKGLKEQL